MYQARLREIEKIKALWEKRAIADGNDPNFTLPDYNLRYLEARYIIRHLKPGAACLDIGCGNGTTTLQFSKYVKHIIGGDYSETAIKKAKELHAVKNIEYRVLDVTKLNLKSDQFDIVISERCIINLPDWESQKRGILEVHRVLKSGGIYLFSESFEEAFVKFAALRKRFGLESMRRHLNNYLIRENVFKKFISKHFNIISVEKMGMYYFVSRIVYPLSIKPAQPRYDADINKVAVDLTLKMNASYFEDISVNGLYVLEKR